MAASTPQEEILGKAYDLKLVKRLWKFIVPYRRMFWLAMALLPLQQAFGLAQPYLMKVGIDTYIAQRDLWGLTNVGLLFLAALIGETVMVFFHYYITMKVAQRCLADMRVEIFRHVQKLPMSYFDRNPVGRLVTRMTTDVDVLQEMFSSGVMTLVLISSWRVDRRHHVLPERQIGAGVARSDPADGPGDQFFPR
jgi:ATP-binding cassette subfamily B protein